MKCQLGEPRLDSKNLSDKTDQEFEKMDSKFDRKFERSDGKIDRLIYFFRWPCGPAFT